MDIITQLKRIKTSKRMTNEELADKTGIPLGTLNKLLSGAVAEPRLSTLLTISHALGCRLSDLIEEPGDREDDRLLTRFHALDDYGRDLVRSVLDKEYSRCCPSTAPLLAPQSAAGRRAMILPLYDLPVSAGSGSYLDGSASEDIRVEVSDRTQHADYALRISGNSMMPKYRDGDILLVDAHTNVQTGELGIFVCDSEGYFKKYGGDRLISLNPDYADILLSGFERVICRGKVLGRLK